MLVTRPAHQAGRLCALIEAHGGRPIRFPTLEIRDALDPAAAEDLLRASTSKSRPWRDRPCTHTTRCAACGWPHCQYAIRCPPPAPGHCTC